MKNIKLYILCAVFALGVVSCQKEGDIDSTHELGFSAAPKSVSEESIFTRGTPIALAGYIPSVGVFGYYTGDGATNTWAANGTTATPNFLNNRAIINSSFASGTPSWSYANPVYWPDAMTANVSFFAYSPYATGLAGNGIEIVSTTGIPVLKYTVPSDCANQPDLMVAPLRNDLNQGNGVHVSFAMKHALTSILFKAAGQGETITKIELTGVKTSGILTTAANGTFSWSDLGGASLLNPKYSQPALTSTAAQLTDADGYLMMIPQTLDANAKLTITVSKDGIDRDVIFKLSGSWVAGETVSYSINVRPDVVEFAMSNIVFDGTKYTFAEDVAALSSKGINANSQGLSFMWGSLIGISGSTAAYDPNTHIPFKTLPGYTGTALAGIDWNSIPYYNEDEIPPNYDQNHDVFSSVYPTVGYDAASGKGDICRYISDQGWVTGSWRMPTSKEMSAYYSTGTINLSNNPSNQGFYGLKFGVFGSASPSLHNGKDVITSGYYFGPGVTTNGSTTLTNNMIVSVPAAGFRNSTDAILLDAGTSGFYWSSSARSNYQGGYLGFTSQFIVQAGVNDRTYAFPVRCVRQ